MKKSAKFFVSIPVKPYVKRFLEKKYNLPVDFSGNPRDNAFFQKLLSKPDSSRDKQYPDIICTYTEDVEVVISEHDFYKYGWELTKTDTVAFGKHFEDQAKLLMRNFVGVYHSLGLPYKNSITRFQQRHNFDEDVWSYQTIKKDFFRNGTVEDLDFEIEIFNKIDKIIMRNLYSLGTVSELMIKEYETA